MNILLVNPPIYDFAAHDLWLKPLGLLYIAGMLKNSGVKVSLIDCLDRNHPSILKTRSNQWGCGGYLAEEVAKPDILKKIPRKYKRYGMPREIFAKELEKPERPDVVLITSGMTYWYPGVIEAINTMKGVYRNVPTLLGGIYATLCQSHAKAHSGADHVIAGNDLAELFSILGAMGLEPPRDLTFDKFPAPMYQLYNSLDYAALRTTSGCPFRCSYCAIDSLDSMKWGKKPVDKVVSEIRDLYARGIKNFAFYDDALFYDPEEHIIPILRKIIGKGIKANFHSPNGLHAKYITKELAVLLKQAGFIMPRISLETTNLERQASTGNKVTNLEFETACTNLLEAGFTKGAFGTYILMGMPNQGFQEIKDSMIFANNLGASVFLVEYSPIPGTRDWEEIKETLPYDDPLWHNNTIFPLYKISDWKSFQALKDQARALNKTLPAGIRP